MSVLFIDEYWNAQTLNERGILEFALKQLSKNNKGLEEANVEEMLLIVKFRY